MKIIRADPQTSSQASIPQNAENGQWGDFNGLSDKAVRIGFIRKVYLIVSIQLLFTFGVVLAFVLV